MFSENHVNLHFQKTCSMKSKIFVVVACFLLSAFVCEAQRFNPDLQEEHLKGPVKSMLTTVRTPQGRVVGYSVRNNFNKEGYFTHNTYYDTIGNPVIMVTYTYDKDNRLLKDIRTHEPYSELLSQSTYIYDKKNRTITAEMVGISDSIEEKTVYEYSKDNVLNRVVQYDAMNKETASTKYEYNELGYMVFSTFTEGENMIYKGGEKFRYDTDGHLAEKCSYYLTTLRQAFLYTYYYDEYGNWIQAYVYHVTPTDGYLYQVITRQISYYE